MGEYSVWAPRAQKVELVLLPQHERVPMSPAQHGHFVVDHPAITPDQDYALSLDGGPLRPDPRSQLQPEGVHGPSRWVDFDAFEWTDAGFEQAPLKSAVLYELHVGTFTQAGTFEAIIERLPDLSALGVTHIELMPVAHFPGERGWGYDGVSLFAPHTSYGGPQGLMKLVNACHAAGVAVLLDVVYNHLGPSGNYLGQFGPYFTSKYHTPWGEALNFDDAGSEPVRRFICDNALHWLDHYHIDGLRLDAIHAIFDQSATHILQQIHDEVSALSERVGRPLVVIAESGLNDARIVRDAARGGYGLESQWSDDVHHALRTVLTGERSGYYSDFGKVAQLADVLRHGFLFRGQYSSYRDKCFGGTTEGLRGRRFVVFSQNHDQVGNRAVGDRLSASLSSGELKIAAALTLLSPFVPMLFMGEEWGTARPFQYFTHHSEEQLAEAVRKGRRREFAAFGWDPKAIPDPQAESTFRNSKLDWREREQPKHAEMLQWHIALLELRRNHPELQDDSLDGSVIDFDEEARWLVLRRGALSVVCSFAEDMTQVPFDTASSHEVLLRSDESVTLKDSHVELTSAGVAILVDGHRS